MADTTFTLSWDVANFNDHRTDKRLRTRPFVARNLYDTTWMCYFVHTIPDRRASLSFYLVRCRDTRPATRPDFISLRATLQLITVNGTPRSETTVSKISNESAGFFFDVFLTWSEVERLYLHPNDTLKIRIILSETDKEPTTKLFARTVGFFGTTCRDWTLTNFSQTSPGLIAKNTAHTRGGDCFLFDVCLSTEDRPGGDVIVFQFTRRCDPSYKFLSLVFLVTILESHRMEPVSWKMDEHVFLMRTAEEVWDFPYLIRKAAFLGENKYLVNDTLNLKGEITFRLGPMASRIEKTAFSIVADRTRTVNHFARNMKDLFNSERFADVKLRANGLTVPAHRFVLQSRSKRFAEMLNNVRGTDNDVLDVPDVDMLTLILMLKYMYTDEIEDLEYDEAVVVYIAAHKYRIESLKCKYSFVIQSHMKVTNVRSILMLADNFCDHDLTNCALDFIIQYWDAVRHNVLGK